ncbi:acetolactate synthase [Sulfolobales archaeon HS-7]|nr:acetolactate synthase [Sulfolobales archaeon HS-7]
MSQPKRKEETVGKQMAADEAIAYTLNETGITKVFTSNDTISSLISKLNEYKIDVTIAPTMRTALLMADTYSRSSGNAGTVIAMPGSSLLEGMDIIAQAFVDSIPLFMIGTIRSYRDVSKSRIGELRTNEDVPFMLSAVTKVRERTVTIEEITTTLEKAYKDAVSNRPRPVYAEVAEDLFKLKGYPLAGSKQIPEKKTPDKNSVLKTAELLINAKNPVIIAGYGVLVANAWNELKTLAELLDVPVISTIKAKGAFPASHELYAGEALGVVGTSATNYLLENADVILALGTRFGQLSFGGWSAPFKGLLVHNNVDGEELGKVYVPHLPAVADTGLFLKELLNSLKDKIKEKRDTGKREMLKKLKVQKEMKTHDGIWPHDIMNEISKISFDTIYVDISSTTIDMIRLPIDKPRGWVTSTSIISKGLSIAGVLENEKSIGVTDVYTFMNYQGVIPNFIKGTLIVVNDHGISRINVTEGDSPFIEKTQRSEEPKVPELPGAEKVEKGQELEKVLKDTGTRIIIVELDKKFESAVLPVKG